MNELTFPLTGVCIFPSSQREQDTLHGVHPGHDVDQCDTHLGGATVLWTGDTHQTTEGLNQEVIACQACTLARTKSRDGAIYDAGVDLLGFLKVETQLCHHTGTKVLNNHVSSGKKFLCLSLAFRRAQVENHGAFVAVHAGEIC